MARLIVAFVRDVINQWNRDEISFGRMVELLNEEARRDPSIVPDEKDPRQMDLFEEIKKENELG